MEFPGRPNSRSCAAMPNLPHGIRVSNPSSSARAISPLAMTGPLLRSPSPAMHAGYGSSISATPSRSGASRVDEVRGNPTPTRRSAPTQISGCALDRLPSPSRPPQMNLIQQASAAHGISVQQLQRTRQQLEQELDSQPSGERSDEEKAKLRELVDRVHGMLRTLLNRDDDSKPTPSAPRRSPSVSESTARCITPRPSGTSVSVTCPATSSSNMIPSQLLTRGHSAQGRWQDLPPTTHDLMRVPQAAPPPLSLSTVASRVCAHDRGKSADLSRRKSGKLVRDGSLSLMRDGSTPRIRRESNSGTLAIGEMSKSDLVQRSSNTRLLADSVVADCRTVSLEPAPEPAPAHVADTPPAAVTVLLADQVEEEYIGHDRVADARFAALHSAEVPASDDKLPGASDTKRGSLQSSMDSNPSKNSAIVPPQLNAGMKNSSTQRRSRSKQIGLEIPGQPQRLSASTPRKATPRGHESKSPARHRSPSHGTSGVHKPLSPRGREFKKVQEAIEEISRSLDRKEISKALDRSDSETNKMFFRREVGKAQEKKDPVQSTNAGERERIHHKPSASAATNQKPAESTALQMKLDAAMKAEEVGVPPDAADKWKVLQLFHATVARSRARVERVRRVVEPTRWASFVATSKLEDLEIGYYTPAGPSQLARLQETGFCFGDFEEMPSDRWGIPVSHHANIAYDRVCGQFNLLDNRGGERCICVLLFSQGALRNAKSADEQTRQNELCVTEPSSLLLAYVLELGVV